MEAVVNLRANDPQPTLVVLVMYDGNRFYAQVSRPAPPVFAMPRYQQPDRLFELDGVVDGVAVYLERVNT